MKLPPMDEAAVERQIVSRLEGLGSVSDEPGRFLVRTFLSPASARANQLVGSWMREAGLTVREDCYGNLTGTRPGPPGSGKWVIGSHLDTVVDAGKFDGPAGVVLGIAVAALLPDLPFTLEVVGFSDEEGVRFQGTYLGSRGYCGLITEAELDLRDKDGISVRELVAARREAGFTDPAPELDRILGYLEMHIEQGPVLEAMDLPLAVVEGIAGQTRILAGFSGKAGHAGTTPMPLRHDALTAASHMVIEAENYARHHPPLLATVGKMDVSPGAGNVIPGEVRFTLDIRSPDDHARAAAVAHFQEYGAALAKERQLCWHWEVKQSTAPVICDPVLTTKLVRAVELVQVGAPRLFSGAGHDAAVLASVVPTAMLFIRCRDGLSHHPDEYAAPGDLMAALQAALHFMLAQTDTTHA